MKLGVKQKKIKISLNKQKNFIISTRPYFRNIFFSFQCLGENFTDSNRCFTFKFVTVSNFGAFFFMLTCINFVSVASLKFVFDLGFISRQNVFFEFFNRFKLLILGIRFAWIINFAIEGYHFRAFLTKLKKMRRFAVLFHLGFFYNVLLFFPGTIKLFWKKRTFRIRGAILSELIMIAYYIRMIRNLFPYKIKGFIYDNLIYFKPDAYEKEMFGIKPGKKTDPKTKKR